MRKVFGFVHPCNVSHVDSVMVLLASEGKTVIEQQYSDWGKGYGFLTGTSVNGLSQIHSTLYRSIQGVENYKPVVFQFQTPMSL